MNIDKFLKPRKNIVIEIEEVEYLLDDNAVSLIKQGDKKIPLVQLYDGQSYFFDVQVVIKTLEKGVVDYLSKMG